MCGENGRARNWPNHADFVTFGDLGRFWRPSGCQNFENSGWTPFSPSLFTRQSEAKRKRFVRFERARSLLPAAEEGRVGAPPPFFSLRFEAKRAKFGKFSALARDRREISQNFRRNRDQRPEFALDLGFGQKVFPNPLSRLFGHLSHRLGKGPEQDPGKSGRKMKNVSSRPGKAARPLQTYSLKELAASFLFDV